MSRFHQTWTCTNCGHYRWKTVSVPKYGSGGPPLWALATRARCTQCGVRGKCKITEEKASIPREK